MKKLENKIALITGATGGIGLATSTLFLQEGAKVVLVDKNQNELKNILTLLNTTDTIEI